jgi:hypothetical protein
LKDNSIGNDAWNDLHELGMYFIIILSKIGENTIIFSKKRRIISKKILFLTIWF